jgi:tRNA threonylcarbamoyladenosine biosynthesis protein TsaE
MTENALSTMAFGRMLGKLLIPGDFIALVGDLGAGKTHFVKGVAQGLEISSDEPVCSPSYTILNIHQGRIPLYHFDLYRLNDNSQISDLGFDEYFEGNGVSIVEWADRMGDQIPRDNLTVIFTIEALELRRLCFKPNGDRPNELLRLISAALP